MFDKNSPWRWSLYYSIRIKEKGNLYYTMENDSMENQSQQMAIKMESWRLSDHLSV